MEDLQKVNGGTELQTKIFIINELVLKELKKTRLNKDHLFILQCLYNGDFGLLDIYDEEYTNERVISYYQTLERKNYIVRDPNMITYYIISLEGKAFFENILSLQYNQTAILKSVRHRVIKAEGFSEWWNLYPSTSRWRDSITGREFTEARPLRTGKEQCKRKYDHIINTGLITHQQLIDCLKYEIKSRKLDSIKSGRNQMCFMKGSLSYLNQDGYTAYLELTKNNPEFIVDCQECQDESEINIQSDDIDNSNSELGN